ncbi:hypothetical protein [Erythrobacter aureus]|nr:hypothetical protein [Erythrobacter aureus]
MMILSRMLPAVCIAALCSASPSYARDIAGITIGMDGEAAANIMARSGTVKRVSKAQGDSFDLARKRFLVKVCQGRVVYAQREVRGDFHTFGQVVEAERRLGGEPSRHNFSSTMRGGRQHTSFGYFWENGVQEVYSVHFSQEKGDFSIFEILDPGPGEMGRLSEACNPK